MSERRQKMINSIEETRRAFRRNGGITVARNARVNIMDYYPHPVVSSDIWDEQEALLALLKSDKSDDDVKAEIKAKIDTYFRDDSIPAPVFDVWAMAFYDFTGKYAGQEGA